MKKYGGLSRFGWIQQTLISDQGEHFIKERVKVIEWIIRCSCCSNQVRKVKEKSFEKSWNIWRQSSEIQI